MHKKRGLEILIELKDNNDFYRRESKKKSCKGNQIRRYVSCMQYNLKRYRHTKDKRYKCIYETAKKLHDALTSVSDAFGLRYNPRAKI
jgi:hypothetical protein